MLRFLYTFQQSEGTLHYAASDNDDDDDDDDNNNYGDGGDAFATVSYTMLISPLALLSILTA